MKAYSNVDLSIIDLNRFSCSIPGFGSIFVFFLSRSQSYENSNSNVAIGN